MNATISTSSGLIDGMGVQHVLDALDGRLAAHARTARPRSSVRAVSYGVVVTWASLPSRWSGCGRAGRALDGLAPAAGGRRRTGRRPAEPISCGQPQQIFSASAVVMLSTPSTGLSVTSATPVS